MKVSLLIRFGGLALLLSQFLLVVVDGAYYLSGRPAYPSTYIAWMAILGLIIRVLGFTAVFTLLAQRRNVFGVAGFILLLFAEFFSVSRMVIMLGVAEGVIASEQVGMAPSYGVIQRYLTWFFTFGQLLFGIAIYQSRINLKVVGLLIALLGILTYLNGPLVFLRPLYAILASAVWGWLGWEIFAGTTDKNSMEYVRT